jgi:NitT/TauT family transport system substrate-binding protein
MEVYQIRVFLEVARCLNFTEAAETLNLTQPAVSAQIKNLESALGTLLFHRLGRKVQLTEAGDFLLSEGGKLVEIETQLRQGIAALKQGHTGKLVVASTAAVANGWLPQQLWQFSQQYPGIQVQLQTFERVAELYRALADEQADLGLCETIPATGLPPNVTTAELTGFRYGLVAAAHHPLLARAWVGLADLQTYPLVLLPPGTPSRIALETRLQELGLSLADFAQVQTVDTVALLRTYVSQGNFLGFVADLDLQPERQAGQLQNLNLLEFAFPYSLNLIYPHHLYLDAHPGRTKSSRSSSPAVKFVQFLQPAHPDIPATPPAKIAYHRRQQNNRQQAAHEVIAITLGVQNATIPTVTAGLIMQRLGLLERFLPRQGRYGQVRYQIQWRNYASGAPIVEDLRAGNLDLGVLGDYPLLLSALDHSQSANPLSYLVGFAAANPNGSCNAIVVPHHSQLQELADLRGRTLALPQGSSAHGMVMRSLSAAKLLEEVELLCLPPDAFLARVPDPLLIADSYAHFAPFPELACRRGRFRYLLSADYQQTPAFYGVVSAAKFAETHPDLVIAYLQALQAAQAWYLTTPESAQLVGQWLGFDTELVAQILNPSFSADNPTAVAQQHFFPTLTIRPDWLNRQIEQLGQVKGREMMGQINLDRWIRGDFLQQIAS